MDGAGLVRYLGRLGEIAMVATPGKLADAMVTWESLGCGILAGCGLLFAWRAASLGGTLEPPGDMAQGKQGDQGEEGEDFGHEAAGDS